MNNTNYTKRGRINFLTCLEQERQQMLAEGMSEADIFRIHFGEYDENGEPRKDIYPGDYSTWLSERKHIRPDHKYAPGTPVSLENMNYEGAWFADNAAADILLGVEQTIDIEAILKTLTPKQKALAEALFFEDISSSQYAENNDISKSAVSQTLAILKKKLKSFLDSLN